MKLSSPYRGVSSFQGDVRAAKVSSWDMILAYTVEQARTAQRNAGTYLADRARTLEAEVDIARRNVAASLAPDRAEQTSSMHASVLASIGLGEREEKAMLEHGASSGEEERQAGASGEWRQENDGLQFAMMHVDVSNRRALKFYVCNPKGCCSRGPLFGGWCQNQTHVL